MTERAARIRALNDRLRQTGVGGRILLTAGVAAMPPETLAAVILAVQRFEDFSADNDPYGEHDFATIAVAGQRVIFKVDYLNRTLARQSDDPSDPGLTARVLTIMLSSEY